MSWITLKTTGTYWEAELMQQMLAAHEIPARIIHQGVASYLGVGCPAALQVRSEDQWTALLLLSPIEDGSPETSEEAQE